MILIAEYRRYYLYYDPKYDDFLVVTPNYKITRYWKRLDSDIANFFDKKYNEYIDNLKDKN